MDENLATNPAAETETPVPATEVAHDPVETTDPVLDENGEPIVAEPVTDEEEIEYEGKKFRGPKEIKEALLRQADYTRKTQEIADNRRALEEQQKQLTEQAEAQKANLKDHARLVALDENLAEWGKVDWQQWHATDANAAQAAFMRFTQMKDARNTLAGELTQKEQQRAFQAQQSDAKRVEESQATLKRLIPEWSPDLDAKLTKYGLSQGLTQQVLRNMAVNNPVTVAILHKAYVGEQLIAKTRAAAKPQPVEAKPVPQVAARSAPTSRDPDGMTNAEWNAWQDKLDAEKRKRAGR